MLDKGLVQIYTGNGKGKTTAAFGLALRAAGNGLKVLIFQFLKPANLELGERKAIEKSTLNIKVEALEADWDMLSGFENNQMLSEVKKGAKQALGKITEEAAKKQFDLLILDELAYCQCKGLADIDDIRTLIRKKDESVEVVITGRDASEELVELADLVTEMRKIKHPFDNGIAARQGIEF